MGHPRNALILPASIAAIFLCIFLTSCGRSSTGGSSGTKTSSGPEETLDTYNFELSDLNSNPLTIYYTSNSKSVGIRQGTSGFFKGTYIPETRAYTINYLSMLNISTDIWDTPSNTFSLQVNEAIKSSGGEFPNEGKILIIGNGANIITVTLSSNGVSIIHNLDAPVSLSWNDFENLLGSQSDTWKQQAGLAWSVIELVSDQIGLIMDSITTIEAKKDSIDKATDHLLTMDCDVFSAKDQSIRSLQWKDTNGDNNLGTGDEFLLTFGNCWINNPNSKVDTLLFGPVYLNNFIEENEAIKGTITLTKTGGQLSYDGLMISSTVENPSGVFTIDATRTKILDGGFSIILTEPPQ
jgi:hypothetical protein